MNNRLMLYSEKFLILWSLFIISQLTYPQALVAQSATKDIEALLEKANAGDAWSEWYVGGLYAEGSKAFPRDESKAAAWWRKAADQGLAAGGTGPHE